MFVLELWDDECRKTTFYTVRKDGAKLNETDRFLDKFRQMPEFLEAVQKLNAFVLEDIGNKYGAKKAFFNRPEEGTFGLPPKGEVRIHSVKIRYSNFPLRLYAMRVNEREDLVVLFNGGAKESGTNIDSPLLHHVMQEAKVFAKKINEALADGCVIVDERSRMLSNANGKGEILIY